MCYRVLCSDIICHSRCCRCPHLHIGQKTLNISGDEKESDLSRRVRTETPVGFKKKKKKKQQPKDKRNLELKLTHVIWNPETESIGSIFFCLFTVGFMWAKSKSTKTKVSIWRVFRRLTSQATKSARLLFLLKLKRVHVLIIMCSSHCDVCVSAGRRFESFNAALSVRQGRPAAADSLNGTRRQIRWVCVHWDNGN